MIVVDDLKKRATDIPSVVPFEVCRAAEIVAVCALWSLPGMLLGLLAAALASVCSEYTGWLGLFGTLLGGAVGMWLESAANAFDLPTP